MPDKVTLAEINERIATIRENLRELTESAAATSGAADEGFAADRIEEQEAQLASLIKQQEALSKPTSYRK
jgi:predicted  nucleic acid-binding Zn-ribbon protein